MVAGLEGVHCTHSERTTGFELRLPLATMGLGLIILTTCAVPYHHADTFGFLLLSILRAKR